MISNSIIHSIVEFNLLGVDLLGITDFKDYYNIISGALIHNYDQFQWDTWINEFKLFGHLLGLIMLLICILFDYSGIIKNANQEKMQYKNE